MYHRLSLWMAVFAFAALGAVRAQTSAPAAGAAAPAAMTPGQITAKQVTGSVSMVLNGTTTALHDNDRVSQSATIITQADSSVVLVFSNGASTQLGGDTTLSIDQFLQDPFTSTVDVGTLAAEPTHSKTKLHLTKGELLGKVAHLKVDEGSSFTIETPVGAAGIRGTTFRIVFRPTGTGQAFAVFALSTVEGNVNFQQGGANGSAPAQPNAGGQGNGQPATPNQAQGGQASGVPVTGGQEVVVTVSVKVDAQTGQLAVTAPPTITATQPISVQTAAALVQQAQNLAIVASSTTFTPQQPASGTSGGTTNSSGSTQSDTKNDQKQSDSGSGNSNNSGTSQASDNGSPSNQNSNTPSQTFTQPSNNANSPSPAVLSNPIPTDPGAGQPGH